MINDRVNGDHLPCVCTTCRSTTVWKYMVEMPGLAYCEDCYTITTHELDTKEAVRYLALGFFANQPRKEPQ